MAEKTFKGIVLLNKKQYNEYYESNPVLKDGCPVICVITPEAGVEADSKLMMKVGDGTTAFRSLPWLSGLSADVYDWALQETKPTYTASEIAFSDGENFQQKYDSGELTGPQGEPGSQGPQGVAGPTGPAGTNGADGRGITSITRTSGTGAAGTVDTYTIKYTDNTTSTFQVRNGADGTSLSGDDYFSKSGPELTYSSEDETVTVKNLATTGTITNGNLIISNNMSYNTINNSGLGLTLKSENGYINFVASDANNLRVENQYTLIHTGNLQENLGELPFIPTTGGEFSGIIYPSTTNTISIGDTNHRLTGIYANNLYMSSPGGSIMHSGSITLYPGGMTSDGISIVADQTNKEFSYIIPSSEGSKGYVGTENFYFSSMHSDTYAFNSGIYLRYNDNNSQILLIEPFKYVSGAGIAVRFGSNQSCLITAGEGCLGAMDDSVTNNENIILCADGGITLINNANTYANRNMLYFSGTNVYPFENQGLNLGTSSYKWNNIYGATIYTNKIEFANDDNITYNDTSNLFSFVADGSVNSSFLQFGQLSVKPAKASSGFGVWYLSGTNDVCVIPLTDLMHQTNGKGNIGTGSYKWDYVQANHVTGTSDLNIKENLVQFDEAYAYESIESLPIYTYKLIDRETTYYVGTTTQEMPVEMVHLFDGGEGSEYLPNSSIWFLYGAFKEAQRKIKALEEQVQNLTQS